MKHAQSKKILNNFLKYFKKLPPFIMKQPKEIFIYKI